jgi:ribosomal protein S18 acetylase RimI-like enzyme
MSALVHAATAGELALADGVACRAYAEYEAEFPEWVPYLRRGVPMTELAREAQVLVAEVEGAIAGAVGYVAPHRAKHAVFPREWAALRFMAVDPAFRRRGVARSLAQECVRLARRDGAEVLGLFTSPAMASAFALYLKMGFEREGPMPPVMGMPAEVLALRLAD